ncbi:hypothetical protein GCM10022377_21610 [Zhihengliuella alba]|uniref:Barstar (barnase inhibitor) domain-containing protein n=1 Tax=Zhihengliuella alba TaxID=547018 RepID=A0ABP7DLX2_9MICC
MARIDVSLVPWNDAPLPLGLEDGWASTYVTQRIEISVDGVRLIDLAGADEVIPTRVTPFDTLTPAEALEVLLGQAQYPEDFVRRRDVPLLLCPCGEAAEGSLLATLIVTDESVCWEKLRWESDWPDAPATPVCDVIQFHRDEYTSALTAAARLSEEFGGRSTSFLRVREFDPGLRHRLLRRWRGELADRLKHFDIHVVELADGPWKDEVDRLVDSSMNLVGLIPRDHRGEPHLPAGSAAGEIIRHAMILLESTESFRLPWPTLESAQWLLKQLRPPSGRA